MNNTKKKKFTVPEMVMCALFAALVAVGAFIRIPLPHGDFFTLQFPFVILSGVILGPKGGAVANAVYVLLGLSGVPVFAAGGGIAYVVRPSFGYLAAFIGAGFITGFICRKLKADSFPKYLAGAVGGFVVTYAVGILYKYLILTLYLGDSTSLWICFLDCFPFLMPIDLLMCGVVALIGKRTEKIRRRYLNIGY